MILRSYIVDLFCILIFVLIPSCYSRGLLYELSGLSESARIAVSKKLNEIETGLESGESFKNRRLLSNRMQSDSIEESASEIPSKKLENIKKDQTKKKQLTSKKYSAITGKDNIPYTKKTYLNKATRTTKNEAEEEARFYPFFKMDDATEEKSTNDGGQIKENSKFLRYINKTPTPRLIPGIIINSGSSEYFEEVTKRIGLKGHDPKPYVTPDPLTKKIEEKIIEPNKPKTETNDFIRSTRCSTASLLPELDATYKPNETVSNEIASESKESDEVAVDNTYVPPEPARIPKHFVDDEK